VSASQRFERVWIDGALGLRDREHPEQTPLVLDWTSREQQRRNAAGRKGLLARALGLQRPRELHIVDATGGLGRDAVAMASLGARVTLIERQPLLVELLSDAHRRATLAGAPASEIASRITIVGADAIHWLSQPSAPADVIHLDPMYPDERRRALPQKAMQMLRALAGDDLDANALLAAALGCGARRVAVKRADNAPPVEGRQASVVISGTQARYDVYLRA